MTITEQIKILCIRSNISVAELARRVGQSPQNFNAKMKKQSFSVPELIKISETVGCKYEQNFVLPNGDKI